MGDLFSQSYSDFKKLKIKEIDVNALLNADYDPKLPMFLQLNLEAIYAKTGMPRFPPKTTSYSDHVKQMFMAHNLLRVYKQLVVDLLLDYLRFFKGANLVIGNGVPI